MDNLQRITHRFLLPQSLKPAVVLNPLTKRNAFLPLIIQFSNSSNGFLTMTVMMSVWNPHAIITRTISFQKVACLRQLIQVCQFMACFYFLSHYLPLNKLIRGYLFAEYKTYMTCPTLEKLASLITF
mgnify:FL=1